jgi:hypothetical protein
MKAIPAKISTPFEAIERVAKQLVEKDKALAALSRSEQVAARLLASTALENMQSKELTKASGVAAITNPADAGKNSMTVDLREGESQDEALARARLHPVVNAGETMRAFSATLTEVGFSKLVGELTRHVNDVKAGNMNRPETILLTQAHTLDMIFHSLAGRAGANVGTHRDAAESYLRMALKAQAQCRATLETLAEIKAPRSTQFIKQQNVANQQQVNNGAAANGSGTPAHAHGKNNPNPSNELLEEQHGERLDSRATSPAIGINSQMQTVGAVDRSENR